MDFSLIVENNNHLEGFRGIYEVLMPSELVQLKKFGFSECPV